MTINAAAKKEIERIAEKENKSVLSICGRIFKDYGYALRLIAEKINYKITITLEAIKSPDSFLSKYVDKLVDGAVIGKIDSDNPILYISGEFSDKLLFLNEFIKTKKISDTIGDAAILKLLRSSYTKSLSALLIETSQLADDYNLMDEFFETLSLTEGVEFKNKSISRINNTLNSSKRKSEELEEIIDYFDDKDLIMVKAALKKLSQ
jgi:hypothetical protein